MHITKDTLVKVFDELKYRKKISSQKDFGDILGYNKSYISELFNGRKEITNSFINALIAKFEISEQWLETGEGDMIKTPLLKPKPTPNTKVRAIIDENTPMPENAQEMVDFINKVLSGMEERLEEKIIARIKNRL